MRLEHPERLPVDHAHRAPDLCLALLARRQLGLELLHLHAEGGQVPPDLRPDVCPWRDHTGEPS